MKNYFDLLKNKSSTLFCFIEIIVASFIFFLIPAIIVLFFISRGSVSVSNTAFFLPIIILYGIILFIVLKKRGKNELYIVLGSFIFSILLIILYVLVTNSVGTERRRISRDGQRRGDLYQIQLALKLFYDKEKAYPIVERGCQDISVLKSSLVPTFIPNVPQERFKKNNNFLYQYAVSGDGSQFVLKATLEDKSSALDQDLYGNILGCNCNHYNYCISQSFKNQ